jgi:hypothetical protein
VQQEAKSNNMKNGYMSRYMFNNIGDFNPYDCESYEPPVLRDKNTPIRIDMHYTDPQARGEAITVFGEAKKGLFYNYNDRLFGDKWDAGRKIAEKNETRNTAKYFEVMLNHFHDTNTVDLQHVLLGVNHSNGYPYLVFGYTYK